FFPIMTWDGLFTKSVSTSYISLMIFPAAAIQRVEKTKRPNPKPLSVMESSVDSKKGRNKAYLMSNCTNASINRFFQRIKFNMFKGLLWVVGLWVVCCVVLFM